MGVSFEAVARSAGLMVTLWGRSWGLRPRLYANARSARSTDPTARVSLAFLRVNTNPCRLLTPPPDQLSPAPYQ